MAPSAASKAPFLANHWKLVAAVALGVAGGLAAGAVPLLRHHQVLFGWDVGAMSYIGIAWWMILRSSEQDMRDRAGQQDEKAGAILLLVLAAILASLGGIVATLMAPDRGDKALTTGLVAATLALGWLLMHTLFVPHYAHRHLAEVQKDKDHGFGFPGQQPTSYLDFAYIAFTVGATFQVSDNSVGSTRLRNLVTAHGLSAYIYNTAILAVGINLLASAVGG
ncbi:MAG: DUF1345 domain-containing protein [Caulobacter sp.]|nr:DUF1345 domain-containing protein [Caulobacter sp.]